MHPHLAQCSSCRKQYEGLVLLERQLENMQPAHSVPPLGSCPNSAVWRQIAAGVTPADETLTRLEHASHCAHCGSLLRSAIEELAALNDEMSEEERNHVAVLASSHEDWQRTLAERIAGRTSVPPDRKKSSWLHPTHSAPLLAVAAIFLVAAVGAGYWFAVNRNQPASAEKLLARAYTEKRTIELRIDGAAFAPMRVSRGAATSFTSRPEALLKAEALIENQLESHPSDPPWLRAKAQADLLEGRYDAALDTLRHAMQLQPSSSALLTDLATAHFQRALDQDSGQDYAKAYEYLSQALKLRPDDPIALFNRAIVAEHEFLYRQALDDWDHYLRVDSSSQWSAEARDRAHAVREKLKQHESKSGPLLSPAEVTALAANFRGGGQVDRRIEQYLHEAVVSWLPQAFPEDSNRSDRSARKALFLLADLTRQYHRDRWLADLLSGSSASNFPQAANALARAVQGDDTANYNLSQKQFVLAQKLFSTSGNLAGVLRAKFEQTIVAQFERHSRECWQEAAAALTGAQRYNYSWLQIQFGLEEAVCSGLMSDLGTDKRAALRAMDDAQKADYGALYLRAVGFVAGVNGLEGDTSGAWSNARRGLDLYWSGQFPVMRGYNLYTEAAFAENSASHPELELAIWREAAALIDSTDDLVLRAMAHDELANAAVAVGQLDIAKQHYAEASRLFAVAPRTEASRIAALSAEIFAAQVELPLDQFDDALVRLTRIQEQVRNFSNNYLAEIFYSTLGELQLRKHHPADAERELHSAVALAERNLASLASEADRTQWSKDAAPAYLALIQSQIEQDRPREALETYEWFLAAPERSVKASWPNQSSLKRSASRLAPEPPPSASSQLSSRLSLLANETVLAYAALPGGLAIWIYDDRGLDLHWIPKPTGRLQELAERFRSLSSDPASEMSALHRDGRALYQELIAPVEQRLMPGRALVIETNGWLASVPFEALLDSSDHYLIERAAIVHSLGPDSRMRPGRGESISRGMPVLSVGSTASSAADGLVPLPDVAQEAEAVASDFQSAHVLKGKEATLNAIRSELPHAAVFHFAGHSLSTPSRTGLMLESHPGLIDADVARQLHLHHLRLAVLSSCSTASGSANSSGFDSITDTLLRSGVPHVVASRWPVDSAATREFVQDFYHNALSGHSVAEAVRMTSRNMLADSRTSRPYYWSAFAAYGQP